MNPRTLKGQSAMEYLMTYGWAILIVIIVAAVLFSLGVFNPATYTTTTATGFSGFNVPSGGFQLSSAGTLRFQLTNGVGATINITGFNATQGSTPVNRQYTPDETTLAPGQTLTWANATGLIGGTAGSSYTVSVTVHYKNLNTGLTGFKSSGTLTGSIS